MQVKYLKSFAVLLLVFALVNTGMAQRKKQVRSGSAYGNSNSGYGNTANTAADTTKKKNNNQSGYGNTGTGSGNNNSGNQTGQTGYGNAAPAGNGIDTTLPIQNIQST